MNVVWNKQAEKELERITDFIAEEYGTSSALNFLQSTDTLVAQLQKYPFIGHPQQLLQGRKHNYRSHSLGRHHLLIYWVNEEKTLSESPIFGTCAVIRRNCRKEYN